MKKFKNNVMSLGLAVVMIAIGLNPRNVDAQQDDDANAQNEWYESNIYVDVRSSGTYIVSECTSITGSSCNMPGSIHRINVAALMPLYYI